MKFGKLRGIDLIAIICVFGVAAGYSLVGALRSNLYIPSRYGSHGVVLSGPAAWSVLASALVLCLAVLIREEAVFVPKRRKTIWEFSLLTLGILLLMISMRLPYAVRA